MLIDSVLIFVVMRAALALAAGGSPSAIVVPLLLIDLAFLGVERAQDPRGRLVPAR